MSQEDPQSGDVFWNSTGYPMVVVDVVGNKRLIYFYSGDLKTFHCSAGYEVGDIVRYPDKFRYLFSFDGHALEDLIKEKYANGDFS